MNCDYCKGIGACPRCWGRAAIDELEKENARLRDRNTEQKNNTGVISASSSLLGYYAYVDTFGRLYFDKCPTLDDHRMAPTIPGNERRMCNADVVSLLPNESINKKGDWYISFRFLPEDYK